jgi:hypothetical protein
MKGMITIMMEVDPFQLKDFKVMLPVSKGSGLFVAVLELHAFPLR